MSVEVERVGGALIFRWAEDRVHIVVDRFSEGRRDLYAEITVSVEQNGSLRRLHHVSVNLLGSRTRTECSNRLRKLNGTVNWDSIIESVFLRAVEAHRQGEPVYRLDEDEEDTLEPTPYLVDPIAPEHSDTVIFGAGGVGKTYVALLFCLLAEKQASVLCFHGKRGNALYLDYEANRRTISTRVNRIKRGHPSLQGAVPLYRRCTIPLRDDVPALQRIIAEHEISFLIVDSLGLACGNELERAESAIQLYSALRSLNVTSLLITHPPKSGEEKSPFGSVYFTNLARSVWEIQRSEDSTEQENRLGLFHRKVNDGPLHPPLGFTMTFNGTVHFSPLDVNEEPSLAKGLSKRKQIEGALLKGQKTAKEVAEETGLDLGLVKTKLSQGKGNWVMQLGKKGPEVLWGIVRIN